MCDEHGIGIDFDSSGCVFERVEMTGAVEPENARAVSSDHPLRSDRNYRGDPVMFQIPKLQWCSSSCTSPFSSNERPPRRSRHQLIAGNAERVNMIVDQSLEGVHASRAGGIEKCQPRRSGQNEAILIRRDVGHMVCDKAVGTSEYLFLTSGCVEAHQAVGGSDVNRSVFGVGEDAVHAKHVLVFQMGCGP